MARIEIRCEEELKIMLKEISSCDNRSITKEIEYLISQRFMELYRNQGLKNNIILQDESEPIPQDILNQFRHRGNL